MQLILASKSEGRKNLLSFLKIPFEIVPSTIDEGKIQGESPVDTLMLRAKAKAEEVLNRYALHAKQYLIISADSGAIFKDKLIGKPRDYEHAVKILKTLSGKTHEFVTAISIVRPSGDPATAGHIENQIWEDYERSTVTFRKLSKEDINLYLSTINYKKYAASYSIISAQNFITKIEGSVSNVIGLPLEKIIPILY